MDEEFDWQSLSQSWQVILIVADNDNEWSGNPDFITFSSNHISLPLNMATSEALLWRGINWPSSSNPGRIFLSIKYWDQAKTFVKISSPADFLKILTHAVFRPHSTERLWKKLLSDLYFRSSIFIVCYFLLPHTEKK